MLYSHKWVCSTREWSPMEKQSKQNVLDLDKLWNFVIHNFVWSRFDAEIFDSQDFIEFIPKELLCSIVTSVCTDIVNDLGWRSDQSKSCGSQKHMHLCSWQLLHLKSSIQRKLRLNFHIWNLIFSNDLGWRNDQNKACRCRKVMHLFSSQLFHLKSSIQGKLHLNFLTFEIQILQTTSDG